MLHEACEPLSTLNIFDTSRLKLESSHPVWEAARFDSISTTRATYVMWLLLGVYNTGERLSIMGKASTAACLLCKAEVDSRVHFMLLCPLLHDIREDFLRKMMDLSPLVYKYMDTSLEFLLCILDPFSPRVPKQLRDSWKSKQDIYKLSRDFCFAMHKKRTKIIESLT